MGVQLDENRSGVIKQTLAPAAVPAQSTSEQIFPCPGLKLSDAVFVVKPSHTVGVMPVHARCSAPGQIAICFNNPTGGALQPPSEQYLIYWMRAETPSSSVRT